MKDLPRSAELRGDLLWLLRWASPDVIVVTHGKLACKEYAKLCRDHPGLPKAIHCIHLSGLGAGKGTVVEDEIQRLIGAINQRLNA